jgi:hypothetical protein
VYYTSSSLPPSHCQACTCTDSNLCTCPHPTSGEVLCHSSPLTLLHLQALLVTEAEPQHEFQRHSRLRATFHWISVARSALLTARTAKTSTSSSSIARDEIRDEESMISKALKILFNWACRHCCRAFIHVAARRTDTEVRLDGQVGNAGPGHAGVG